jgi:hypothetical protein
LTKTAPTTAPSSFFSSLSSKSFIPEKQALATYSNKQTNQNENNKNTHKLLHIKPTTKPTPSLSLSLSLSVTHTHTQNHQTGWVL